MPTAALYPCSMPGCQELVPAGRCAKHRAAREYQRGNAYQRGYGSSRGSAWQRFRRQFITLLFDANIAPICGASLPDGPQTQDSHCQQAGLLIGANLDGSSLHFDHEPPLQDHERKNQRAVCDPRRIQLLCNQCHNAKTRTHQLARTP